MRGSIAAALVLNLVLVAITAFKGKYLTALFGLPIAPVAWIAAFRLARPHSLWTRKLYSAKRIEHATRRAVEFDERWGPVRSTWDDFIGGRPSQPYPSSSSH
ncbi:hypothetical protein IEE94_08170 [Yimella sp. cx-573]|nr:hypothetical protein [Yimella sp. cx-573]